MNDSFLKKALIECLEEDYTKQECEDQLKTAKVEITAHITYANGVKDTFVSDDSGKFQVVAMSLTNF